jgi:SpoVK/Ycf46/Vps4 family AAA+-type ATPase
MFESLIQLIQGNQVLLTALGLGSAGILTFWIKDLPKMVFELLKRELTTSLTITSHNIIFFHVLKWVGDNYNNKNFRELKVTNGKWGDDDKAILSVGYGVHFIRFHYTWFLLRLVRQEANQTMHDKEILTLTKLGRDKNIFLKFINETSKSVKDKCKTKIYRFDDEWSIVKLQNKRDIKTVFLESDAKQALLNGLKNFSTRESWYEERGIPYQLGVLLYGPPGTGKTTLIRAIASYLDYPLYVISTSKMLKIESAFEKITEKCIVVLEDIDCQTFTHSRESNNNAASNVPSVFTSKQGDAFAGVGLSEILNALDGICSVDGRILIATTNHIDKLDSALVRSGRFDIQVKVDYVTLDTLQQFFSFYFPDFTFNVTEIRNNITIAKLQELVIKNYTPEQIVDFVTNKHICINN